MQIQQLQKRLPLIISAATGILAVILMQAYLKNKEGQIWDRVKQEVKQTLNQTKSVQPPPPKMGMVLVAKKEIPAETPITASDIEVKEIPVDYIQPGAVTALDKVIGQISTGPLAAGEQILPNKLQPAGNIGKSIAEITPEGKRATTITVDNISTIAGLLRPGDYVDVFALITPPASVINKTEKASPKLILIGQHIGVLAVGSDVLYSPHIKKEESKGRSAGQGTVTLALTPQEAALFAFVQEHGKIRLVLRSPEDAKIEPVNPADWDTVLHYLYPYTTDTEEGKQAVVEIYHGLEKEVTPLTGKKQ